MTEIISFEDISRRKNIDVCTMWRNPSRYKYLRKLKRKEKIRNYIYQITECISRCFKELIES